MTDALFSLTFVLAAPFWVLMILAPTWRMSRRVISSPWLAAPAALVYLALVLPHLGSVLAAVTSPSLPELQALLATPEGAAIGWAHFIAFDVFVGRWMYLDSRDRGVHPMLMAPILVLTILRAPIGFLGYLGVRSAFEPTRRRRDPLSRADRSGRRPG